jgi:hypothetical protein
VVGNWFGRGYGNLGEIWGQSEFVLITRQEIIPFWQSVLDMEIWGKSEFVLIPGQEIIPFWERVLDMEIWGKSEFVLITRQEIIPVWESHGKIGTAHLSFEN